MPYYATVEEDLTRAREILEKGKLKVEDLQHEFITLSPAMLQRMVDTSGHIYGGDNFAAYKLLESLVAEVERSQSELRRLLDTIRGTPVERCRELEKFLAHCRIAHALPDVCCPDV